MFCSLSLSLPLPSLCGWVTSRTRSAEWGVEEDRQMWHSSSHVPSPGEKKVRVSLSSHQAQNLDDTSHVLQKNLLTNLMRDWSPGEKPLTSALPSACILEGKWSSLLCSLPPWMFLLGWKYYCVSSEEDGRIKTQLFSTFIIFLQRISSQISNLLLSSLGGVVVTQPVLLSFSQSCKDVSHISL